MEGDTRTVVLDEGSTRTVVLGEGEEQSGEQGPSQMKTLPGVSLWSVVGICQFLKPTTVYDIGIVIKYIN